MSRFERWGSSMNAWQHAQKQRMDNNWDDLDEAIHRNILKRTSIRGWLYVTFTKPRKFPPPRNGLTFVTNNTSKPERTFNQAQWERITDHLGKAQT